MRQRDRLGQFVAADRRELGFDLHIPEGLLARQNFTHVTRHFLHDYQAVILNVIIFIDQFYRLFIGQGLVGGGIGQNQFCAALVDLEQLFLVFS